MTEGFGTSPARVAALVVVGIAAVGVGVAVWRAREPALPDRVTTEEPEDAGVVDWCAPGLQPIAGGGCFAPAHGASPLGAPAPLVVYLHGRYEQTTGVKDEMDRQHRVAERATARGFAVLALRGRLGECRTNPDLATWFCWPSNEHTAEDAPAFVSAWGPALRAAQKLTGDGGKRFVLGFSNGAYFAGLLAVGAHLQADAFAVAAGGTVEPVKPAGAKPPVILLSSDSDESQPGMIQFDAELTREGWAHEVYARAGGHLLLNEDIDAALTFFLRSQREKVPLSPPITTHRPNPQRPDAGPPPPTPGEAEDAASASPPTPGDPAGSQTGDEE